MHKLFYDEFLTYIDHLIDLRRRKSKTSCLLSVVQFVVDKDKIIYNVIVMLGKIFFNKSIMSIL